MNRAFLAQLADELLVHYPNHLKEVTVVVPTRRAGLFLQKHLLAKVKNPIWAPLYTTPSALLHGCAGLEQMDDLGLLGLLYRNYIRISGSKETFSQFFSWGDLILSDFDATDKSLVDAPGLFSRLRSEKEIEQRFPSLEPEVKKLILKFWMGFEPEPSPTQQQFLRLWETLPQLYEVTRDELLKEKKGYDGLIQRYAVTHTLDDLQVGSSVVVAGFNWLSPCEQALIQHLKTTREVRFFWDAAPQWLADPSDDRGKWIRLHQARWGGTCLDVPGDGPELTWTGAHLAEGQAAALSQSLQALKDVEPQAQAILFPQEHLLMPVLHALPAELGAVNLSLGYPVRRALVFDFFQLLFSIFQTLSRDGKGIETSLWLRLLSHPLGGGRFPKKVKEWDHTLRNEGALTVELAEVDASFHELKPLVDFLRDPLPNLPVMVTWLSQTDEIPALERAAVQFATTQLRRLMEVVPAAHVSLEQRAMWKLLRQVLQRLRVPFVGEPVDGMQMLGLIEAQSLDFDVLHLLSLNEDAWPSAPSHQGIVPYHLKKAFGLPLPEDRVQQETYAFFRTIRRAKRVFLYSNTLRTGSDRAELSRFIYRLKWLEGASLKEIHQAPEKLVQEAHAIEIPKTGWVWDTLQKIRLESGISPSSLGTYLYCPLRFYFQNVLRLRETIDISKELDARILGNMIHHAMEFLYGPFAQSGQKLTQEVLEGLRSEAKLTEALTFAFREQFKIPEDRPIHFKGEWLVIREVIFRYLRWILTSDAQFAPIQMLALEAEKKAIVTLSDGGEALISGKVDRIDEVQDGRILRVLDYKTGQAMGKTQFDDIAALFSPTKPGPKEVLQVLLYCWILAKNGHRGLIAPGLIFVRALHNEGVDFSLSMKMSEGVDGIGEKGKIEHAGGLLSDIERHLVEVLDELFNPKIAFSQTQDLEKCALCPFNKVCER